jgi:hypothetical protein
LTAPGPTPLRTATRVDDESQSETSEDDMLSITRSPQTNNVMDDVPLNARPLSFVPTAVFILKIASLLLPCYPYTCSRTILFGLLGLACLDLLL